MNVQLQTVSEAAAGRKWQRLFESHWPSYREWFLKQGEGSRPNYLTCEQALRRHMPELLTTYQRLVQLAGGSDIAARFLSLYCPTPYMTGCSQAVWTRNEALLVRNYDYHPGLWDAVLLHSAWNGRWVMGMSDCGWGLLDGINQAGLAVSLAFGGRTIVGEGFGIPVILRYVLEFCETTEQAVAVLARVPSHMAYNVMVLDAHADHRSVYVAPDRPAMASKHRLSTNHQQTVEWAAHARATASLDRAHFLALRLSDPRETSERFTARFLDPPLYQARHEHGWGTLYTAVYNPLGRTAAFRWPRQNLRQSLHEFSETTVGLAYQGHDASRQQIAPPL